MYTLQNHPTTGTVVTREEFDPLNTTHEGVSLTTNYQVLGPYGPDQQVEILGVTVTVWAESGQSASGTLTDSLNELVAALRAEAEGLCPHARTTELSPQEAAQAGQAHFGNCYHVYRCQDCDVTFGLDTSD
jgi:hypothetical protein